jgi:hypothetical protein
MSPPAHDDARDFDLHGIVGVRVVSSRAEDVRVVRRQLGLPATTLDREPDITVRFVEELTSAPLTHVGRLDTAYAPDLGFVVQRGRGSEATRTLVPFDRIGKGPELVCERGVPAVPHLLAIINLTALANGVLPLHASAFNLGGRGFLVTGWAKSGKTETLLAAARRGARYVGDEWVYLTQDGGMFGLPEPIRLWAWHLDQFPDLWRSRPTAERGRVEAWRSMARAVTRLARTPRRSSARRCRPPRSAPGCCGPSRTSERRSSPTTGISATHSPTGWPSWSRTPRGWRRP